MASPNLQSLTSNLLSYAIIVAGGTGSRMQSEIPKQFLLLKGRPVIMHTIEAFYYSATQPQIIIVLHVSFHAFWEELCEQYSFKIPYQLVSGGETRFHSVKNGLDTISNDTTSVIAVHDAVRPLTSKQIIDESYRFAAEHGNAVTAVKSRDSIRQLRNGISACLLRDEIYLVQTPQTFQSRQLKNAYLQPFDQKFTDDASVVEETGVAINLIDGSYRNIKITFPEDMVVAEALLRESMDHRP